MAEITETTCRCKAIPYPHRFMSGNCDGWTAVEAVFDDGGECRECRYNSFNKARDDEPESRECWLIDHQKGRQPVQCPGLSFITFDRVRRK